MLKEYKEKIAQTITELGVETLSTQTSDVFVNNIDVLAQNNYNEGKESDIVLIKSDLSSRDIQTISLTNIQGYENFNEEDFIIVNKNMLYEHPSDNEGFSSITKSYDKQTGTLTLGKQKDFANYWSWTFWNTYDLYAIKRKVQKVDNTNSTNTKYETLSEFKNKLAKKIEEYGIENDEQIAIENMKAEQISEIIKKISQKKFNEGVSTFLILIQENLSSRYNQTVSISNLENFNTLNIDDFMVVNRSLIWTSVSDNEDIETMSKNYDQNTGTLNFGKQKIYSDKYTFWNTYDVYLLKKEIINLEN